MDLDEQGRLLPRRQVEILFDHDYKLTSATVLGTSSKPMQQAFQYFYNDAGGKQESNGQALVQH